MISNLLQTISHIIESFLPFVIVPEYETGIRWTFGHPGKCITGGCLWKIPLVQDVESIDITAGSFTLESQCLTTSDNVTVNISVGIVYRIEDPLLYCMTVGDNDSAEVIGSIARGIVTRNIGELDWSGMSRRIGDIEDKRLLPEIQDAIEQYGLTVDKVAIAELSKVIAIKTFS